MADRTRLTDVDTVVERGSWLFTVCDSYGNEEEVVLVPCGDGVEAWVNRCTHESQRLDTGCGAPIQDGQIICPRHGSTFDTCTGYCDDGEAADTTLGSVDVAVDAGAVFLVDEEYSYRHDGGIGDDGPSSTSHLRF